MAGILDLQGRSVTVASDDGMDVDQVERQLRTYSDIKLIYLEPNFRNPSGTTLV